MQHATRARSVTISKVIQEYGKGDDDQRAMMIKERSRELIACLHSRVISQRDASRRASLLNGKQQAGLPKIWGKRERARSTDREQAPLAWGMIIIENDNNMEKVLFVQGEEGQRRRLGCRWEGAFFGERRNPRTVIEV